MSLLGMGSVSSYVLEHSPVPTAIVRYGAVLDTGSKPQLVRCDFLQSSCNVPPRQPALHHAAP